ncbi:9461_t:CDS:2, partial [Funneliformis geosporum]
DGDNSDRELAKCWEIARRSEPSINIQYSIVLGKGTIYGGTTNGDEEQTKRVRFHEEKPPPNKRSSREKKRDTLPDGTKVEKATTLNLNWILPSGKNVCDIVSRKISANAEAIKKKKKISASEKATLRYGSSRIIDLSTNMTNWFSVNDRKFMMKDHKAILQVPVMTDEENSFVVAVENIICEEKINEAYDFCIKKHINSEKNSYIYKLSKIYSDFIYRCKDQTDMLGSGHTEIDVILKTCSYIIEGLNQGLVIRQRWGDSFCPLTKSTEYNNGRKCDVRFLSALGVDIGEWEFASNFTAQKAIGDRCRSARINQSILNGCWHKRSNVGRRFS